ncbi:DUF4229 domain-containing protein [Tsukamurella sp. 8F]|uniref:DUF4229 domain-containing protein n=1 Tax=unclassified Tsukamurella TaxID=2633480 RepID=UPI0023B8E2FA|nr:MULTISPECIES: DUF4229 domain-containing protein [unclassified Tsukamurella]MDF0531658.1 DUF4229 domain-containing protein [Tsukamurella sp. 8J]MDF0588774.1 DUF4229 domain-containing protein [Tsukamurella sp. 8F]
MSDSESGSAAAPKGDGAQSVNADESLIPEGTRPDALAQEAAKRGLVRDVGLYTIYRIALVVVLAAILYAIGRMVTDQMPVIVAVLFAIVIALPVSMVTARGLRRRITGHAAVLGEARRDRRDAFRKRLQGRVD